MGPAGLQALVQTYQEEIRRHVENLALKNTVEWQRLSGAMDAVSQQKDSYLAQLYWYRDINAARTAARASHKPILSLRLLGKLSEEFSCANSRFFRAVLYSNTQVSKALNDRFILHWQTVRAVPRITIDFGDGRKLERTITGNSIHYVLDSEGQPIDGFPGLYGPAAFLRGLEQAETVFKKLEGKNAVQREGILTAYHRGSINSIALDWLKDTKQIGGAAPRGMRIEKGDDGEALAIMPIAVTKAITEASILRSMTAAPTALGAVTDEAAWKKIAELHRLDAQLDKASIGLIQRQMADLMASGTSTQASLANLIQKLENSIALDTVRNEYLLHTELHSWLATSERRASVDALNEKVYAELFLTPGSDPWYGLFSPEAYTALQNGGVVVP
jgi:hypothetical protein